MRKIIENIRLRLALWLLITPRVKTATEAMVERVERTRCVHRGKNPFFIDEDRLTHSSN